MIRRSTVSRVLAAIVPLAVVAALAVPTTARAAEKDKGSKKACGAASTSYKSGAEREKAGRLSEARALYAQCVSDDACPGLQPRCRAARDRVEGRMPSIVPVVMDESGALTDVEVKIDGQTVTSHLDGRALPVEMGPHELTLSSSKGALATEKILVVEGAKNREIDVYVGGARPTSPLPVEMVAKTQAAPAPTRSDTAVGSAPTAQPADPSSPASSPEGAAPATLVTTRGEWEMPRSPIPYVIGGVGLLSAATGVLLTVWGNQDNNQLGQCSPSCPSAPVDRIRSLYVGADIAFGVGVAALGVSAVLFATSHKTERAVSVGVAPTRSGAMAALGGSF